VTPLFLFSGTFFPLDSLPEAVRPVAWITPLYHGGALTRGLSLGTLLDDPVLALIHVMVLLACVAAGTVAMISTINRRLVR
jgi:lipooligosaccharide transport system permease protein